MKNTGCKIFAFVCMRKLIFKRLGRLCLDERHNTELPLLVYISTHTYTYVHLNLIMYKTLISSLK